MGRGGPALRARGPVRAGRERPNPEDPKTAGCSTLLADLPAAGRARPRSGLRPRRVCAPPRPSGFFETPSGESPKAVGGLPDGLRESSGAGRGGNTSASRNSATSSTAASATAGSLLHQRLPAGPGPGAGLGPEGRGRRGLPGAADEGRGPGRDRSSESLVLPAGAGVRVPRPGFGDSEGTRRPGQHWQH